MDQAVSGSAQEEPTDRETKNLSYKFQRLREKLRSAISSGELAGKLPGERALAKRFHVNAKTLSKALTDLAAEGLLDRSIGRGTFVKGSAPQGLGNKRWLVLCGTDQVNSEIVSQLSAHQPDMEIVTDFDSLRPSFLSQFSAVIDLCKDTPDSFIRDLVVRNIAVVLVGKEPKIYSTHAVVFDKPLAISQAGRQLVINGHDHVAAVGEDADSVVSDGLRLAVPRMVPEARVESCAPQDAPAMVEGGITAFVCQSVDLAVEVKAQLERAGIAVPERASIVAIGAAPVDQAVSGFFITRADKARAITELLRKQVSTHPTTVWLAGRYVDRGTLAPRRNRVPTSNRLQTASANGSIDHSDL